MSDSVQAPARKNNRCGSHEGERIGMANRSIRAQELSVVEASEVDMVRAPAREKNNRCVSAKRGKHGPPRPREFPYSVSATPDHWL